ncbi:hypothetical protein KXS11_16770 [Plantibacter flavus]|uniref:hypothetical protein n=1 Tax=Plantibacter flavus TaxID=150123 RepID=UPI003F13D9DD
MSVIRTPQYRSASRRVLDWCAWYTRDLAPEVAGDRRDEIASDLHDHAMWAEEAGVPPERLRRDIVLRAVRGIPHDLSWRSGQLRAGFAADPMPLGTRRIGNALATLVVGGGALIAIFGVFLLVRVARALLIADIDQAPSETLPVAVFTVLAIVAVILAARRRTRWLGALILAPSAAMIGMLGAQVLYFVSATGQLVISRFVSGREGVVPWWILVVAVCIGAALGFLGAAIWWWPTKERVGDRVTSGETA